MDLNSIKEEELKDVFDALEEAFTALGIDYYLIGAIARDVWYSQANKTFRTSKDIDFAVFVGSTTDYEQVRKYLIEKKKFIETRENAFVLFTPNGVQIDILPFGAIEIDFHVNLKATGLSNIKVNGFQEVYQSGTVTMTMKTGHNFKVATLPAIVLLKLVAYDDRPEEREKDPRDIANIIEHFVDIQQDLIYVKNCDLFRLEGEAYDNLQQLYVTAN